MKKFLYNHPFALEFGFVLPSVEIAYHTMGCLSPDGGNVIWVCHALTANSNVADWWSGLFGPGKLYDPKKYFIVCANVLGSCYGTSGPLSTNPQTGNPYYHQWPFITIRDMVGAHELLRKELGIQRIHTLIGGSMGGFQAIEWAIREPHLAERLVLVATSAKHSAWGIAFNESQRLAIEADNTWKENRIDAGREGLKAARSIALLSYRHYNAYVHSQSETSRETAEHFKASAYQRYQGEKLANRFNAFSYYSLSKSMDSHNISRGRNNTEQTLGQIKTETLVIGINSDVLFPPVEQAHLALHIPNSRLELIDSNYGHDGFLVETEKLTEILIEQQLPQHISL